MIRCIIVDDEPLARQLLEAYVAQLPYASCVAVCESAAQAFAAMHAQSIDVIFLDIQMPGITGLNFLRSLKTYPKVIFTTAYPNYAVDAFELEAVDYLVKPITFERFERAIQKIVPKTSQTTASPKSNEENTQLFLKVNKRLVKIDHKDIIYAESIGDYLKVYTATQTYTSYMTLGKLEALLPATQFIRIHRSTIVGLAHIQYVEGSMVKINGKDLPVGLTYKNNLAQRIGRKS
jgi:DNA-binding LytR/AlgR family response regulator